MLGYSKYLFKSAGVSNGGAARSYFHLTNWLNGKLFYCLKFGDNNRVDDVYTMRDEFDDAPEGPECSCLEIFIALARRMVFMAEGIVPRESNTIDSWYMDMVSNLGLAQCNDDFWEENEQTAMEIANNNVDVWLNREYEYDGCGGLFPLANPKDDQTNVEIWYQMNAYLMEKME